MTGGSELVVTLAEDRQRKQSERKLTGRNINPLLTCCHMSRDFCELESRLSHIQTPPSPFHYSRVQRSPIIFKPIHVNHKPVKFPDQAKIILDLLENTFSLLFNGDCLGIISRQLMGTCDRLLVRGDQRFDWMKSHFNHPKI